MTLLRQGNFLMAYRRVSSAGAPEIALATSSDGRDWTYGVTALAEGAAGQWDEVDVTEPALIQHQASGDTAPQFYLWYTGRGRLTSGGANNLLRALGLAKAAVSPKISAIKFARAAGNPVLLPKSGANDDRGVGDPWVLLHRGAFRMWYVGYTWGGKTEINLAMSEDGVRWIRYPGNPVLRAASSSYFGSAALRGPSVINRWGDLYMIYGGQDTGGFPSMGQVVNRVRR